jgi:hypothetical protein
VKARERVLAYRPSASMIVALVALFVAMGGTTYAVKRLPAKSVGATQLKRNAVRTANIKARNVTRSRIAKGAIDGSLVASNSLTGSDIRESSLGTVRSATSAATAGDAATVGGRTVQKFSFVAPGGTAATTVLSLKGLSLTSTCTVGPALSVTATTAVNDAVVHVHAGRPGLVSQTLAGDNFDVGDNFDPLPSPGGTEAVGELVYVRQDGEVVTASYLTHETATGCIFAGTAIG